MPDYTILLIDYDPDSAERLRRPLTLAGYRVEIATDGLAGISRFHELSPHLTLIEAMIPKKHGFEVCQELKQTPHGQRSAVWILTSVYKGRKYRTQAFLYYKCDEYLEKPIDEDEFLKSVNGYFEELARRAEVSESPENGASAVVPETSPPEVAPRPAAEPLGSEVPDELEIPAARGVPGESRRGRMMLWSALALLVALGGLLAATLLL